jgi:hypothetical protein
MNIKRILLLTVLFCSISFLTPKTSQAIDLQTILTSKDSIVEKIQEGIEYFFAFKVENKVAVLEKQAEKKLNKAENYADNNDNEKMQSSLQNYLQVKEKQNDLLGKNNDKEILNSVEERTIEQQKTMEEIKTKINDDGKQNVIDIQEKVVNQIAKRIVVINGPEGQTEFFNKVEHVWAPGTGPGGEAGTNFAPGTSGTNNGGVIIEGGLIQFAPGTSAGGTSGRVIEGGAGGQFAPGTSAGGNSAADIKNVEVKTGGVVENGLPPGVIPGDGGKAVDSLAPGTTNSSNGSGTWTIDP